MVTSFFIIFWTLVWTTDQLVVVVLWNVWLRSEMTNKTLSDIQQSDRSRLLGLDIGVETKLRNLYLDQYLSMCQDKLFSVSVEIFKLRLFNDICWRSLVTFNRLIIDQDFWTLMLRLNWEIFISIAISQLSIWAFWKCQDFLDCRDMFFETVKIKSLNRDYIKTNRDPQAYQKAFLTKKSLLIKTRILIKLANNDRFNHALPKRNQMIMLLFGYCSQKKLGPNVRLWIL
jgi:hypothetical protein